MTQTFNFIGSLLAVMFLSFLWTTLAIVVGIPTFVIYMGSFGIGWFGSSTIYKFLESARLSKLETAEPEDTSKS